MANPQQQRYQQMLGQLYGLVQQRHPAALSQIEKILQQAPRDPNLLHLAGLAALGQEQPDQAASYLEQALAVTPNNPEIQNSLANSKRQLGDLAAAIKHYRKACELKPDYFDAWKNLGITQLDNDRATDAVSSLQEALRLRPDDPSAHTAIGNVFKELEQFQEAEAHYRRALELRPDYVNALHNLGLNYKLDEQLDAALDCYQKAQTLAPAVAEIDMNIGNALFEKGEYEKAQEHYQTAVEKNPGFVLGHETLAEFFWQTGRQDKMVDTYESALRQQPDNLDLRQSYVETLIATEQFEEAYRVASAFDKHLQHPAIAGQRARILATGNRFAEAIDILQAALNKGFDFELAQSLAKTLVVQGDYSQAETILDQAQSRNNNDQLNWALRSLCWRLQNDERYAWLIDYQRYIQPFELPTPKGFASQSEFIETLRETLLAMHRTDREPSRQTLKNGTQTPGRLLHKPDPVIQAYRESLATAVAEYIAAMPDDDTHPLLQRKSEKFHFAGSWSVKLRPEGFHVNHVHPEGWISSACYIAMPQTPQEGDAGAIKFGESGLPLEDREVVERIIQPRAGQLVLFPSYVWHGTFPFSGDESDFRMTAPFDVVPVHE